MNKYNNSKIYKLICEKTNKIYIGSTTRDIRRRLSEHKMGYLKTTKDFINMKIEIIENFSCNSKKELQKRERYFIENLDCVNYIIPTRNYNERYKLQPKIDYMKKYYNENKDNINEKNKIKIKCECGCLIRKADISTHRKSKKHLKLINLA